MFPQSYSQLQIRAQAEIELRKRGIRTASGKAVVNGQLPEDWEGWLKELFPTAVKYPFSFRHRQFWQWVDGIKSAVRPRPFVAIWPRGGAKSSSAEMAVIRLGAKKERKYIWYVSGVQEQADKHVETIAEKLESKGIGRYYPDLARRHVGKYGTSKGWRRERLWTESGFVIDALGLDTGLRGAKVGDVRPDAIILDDLDSKYDSSRATMGKIEHITTDVLPAGSDDCAVLFVQNIIHPDSIAARLVDGRADFLLDRIISGPFPAIEGLVYQQGSDGRFVITGGKPTWEGQSIEICQSQINTWGISAFLNEAQHKVELTGGIWDHIEFRYCEFQQVPKLIRGCVWVDPAVTSTDNSDCQGIQADGIAADGKIFRVFSWEGIDSPENTLKRAILKAIDLGFDHVGVETDQGGDTWYSVYNRVCDIIRKERPEVRFMPSFSSDKAGAGYGSKIERNAKMLIDYEQGQVIHVKGPHAMLDRALKRFPNKPLDLADASFWSWNDLRNTGGWAMGAGR